LDAERTFARCPDLRLAVVVRSFLKWLPSYFLPWNVFLMALATAIWFFATPSLETMKVLALDWIAFIWVRNMAIVLAVYGSLELWLYPKRRKGGRFKYNGLWPSDRKSKIFGSSRRTSTISSAASAQAYLSGRPMKS
jgi:hypothetical protein